MARNPAERRQSPRRRCRGSVLVYEMDRGSPVAAELIDISQGGIRLTIGRRIARGEVVRVLFRRRGTEDRSAGKMIIGQVVRSEPDGAGCVASVAFGWDAVLEPTRKTIRKDARSSRLFQPLARRLRAWLGASVGRA